MLMSWQKTVVHAKQTMNVLLYVPDKWFQRVIVYLYIVKVSDCRVSGFSCSWNSFRISVLRVVEYWNLLEVITVDFSNQTLWWFIMLTLLLKRLLLYQSLCGFCFFFLTIVVCHSSVSCGFVMLEGWINVWDLQDVLVHVS